MIGTTPLSRALLLSIAISLSLTGAEMAIADEVYVIAPGPEGEDVSYYSFLPLLQRGEYTTMYAHTADDDQGVGHSMESFIKFPLSEGLLAPDETVLNAFLVMVFAFTFDHSGAPPAPDGVLSIHEVTEDWEESTLNFANHPASGPAFETIDGISEFGSIYFDVTDSVRDWAHGVTPNYGFKLSNPEEDPIGFHTFEADVDPALKAQLIITVPEPSATGMLVAGAMLIPMLHRRRSHPTGARGRTA